MSKLPNHLRSFLRVQRRGPRKTSRRRPLSLLGWDMVVGDRMLPSIDFGSSAWTELGPAPLPHGADNVNGPEHSGGPTAGNTQGISVDPALLDSNNQPVPLFTRAIVVDFADDNSNGKDIIYLGLGVSTGKCDG
jgi:hypothetical protein